MAVYHWHAWNAGIVVQSLGTFGVYLFFVLSALTMAMVYAPAFGDRIEWRELAGFFRNRAARLLPLLFVVALGYFALAWLGGSASIAEAVKAVLTGTGLFGLALPGMLSNATGAWSLGIELLFYAVVPVCVLMVVRGRLKALVAILAVLLAAQQLYLLLIAPLGAQHWDYYTVPLTFAPFFALGFLVFKLGGSRAPAFLAPTLALFLAIATFSLWWPADLFRENLPFVVLTALAGATIYCANRTELPRFLEAPAEFLGDISYSMYLTHPVTNIVVLKATAMLGLAAAWTLPLFLLAAMASSYAIFRLFERPLRQRFRQRRLPEPEVATLP